MKEPKYKFICCYCNNRYPEDYSDAIQEKIYCSGECELRAHGATEEEVQEFIRMRQR